MRIAAATLLLSFGLTTSACSGGGGSQTSHDCQDQVRANGIVYTSHGYTEHHASKHSVAERADCHDVGEGAAGSVFPENPEQVTTWSFSGYPTDQVVGVRLDEGTFAVFTADSLSDGARERIYRELQQPPS
jgi:hypothetical protein